MKTTTLLFVAAASVALFVSSPAQENDYRLGLMTEGGIPTGVIGLKVLVNQAYAVGYSEDLKVPLWCVYRLGNRKAGTAQKWERPSRFEVDYRTQARVGHDDYVANWDGKSWQRGHMAPNAAIEEQFGQMAQFETYLMSNIIPQTDKLNTGLWMKLEGAIRDKLAQDDTSGKEIHDVWVTCGPIFEPPVRRWPNGIAVPSHCYMIVGYRRGYGGTVKAAGFIFPQVPTLTTIDAHAVKVREIEAKTGLNFFPELTAQRQNNLENVRRDLALNDLP